MFEAWQRSRLAAFGGVDGPRQSRAERGVASPLLEAVVGPEKQDT